MQNADSSSPPSPLAPAMFDLPLNPGHQHDVERGISEVRHFRTGLSLKNASWFCRLRWGIISILVASGAIGQISGIYYVGYRPNTAWLFLTAGLLCLANLTYLAHLNWIRKTARINLAEWNLRVQIAIDLAFLTVVVHFLGSIETFAPFIYLLHIVLACIFFTRNQSLVIMLLAYALYLGCLMLEWAHVIPTGDGIYTDQTFRAAFGQLQIFTNTTGLLFIWTTIWVLASRLSRMISAQSRELAVSNQHLVRTQTEKTKHMLRTTHELKAPFAAIHANAQLLLNGYCGSFSPEALKVIRRISERSHALSLEIQAMLQLANLSTVSRESLRWNRFDISDILRKCIDSFQALAGEKNVTIVEELKPVIIFGVEDHLNMMFSNLISNAIHYSYSGGRVTITCSTDATHCTVSITDTGIGIMPEKLSRIFEEHYRTEEAAAHNKQSSGLGLAIVSNVARTHQIPVHVESTPGSGTCFTVRLSLLNKELGFNHSAPGLNRWKRILHFAKGS
ncbi:MAG TPA: hypothetical protein DCS07_15560 [Bdellovibrionales bacterium]|nr:MAG: hypothetical protein A2X97_10135 [Bdellovibrionales bacterium GWA1_52_35]OFZ39177.1 MAG: hypothetical protein A2070_01345 [Bdellovibrionales bacterium GWC1_52_8]HAR44027.1 hypothetical protein [Bdellovibrionales bacterium]HCM40541.1 hypothetical protein [Bdellovibrionales bacterium]